MGGIDNAHLSVGIRIQLSVLIEQINRTNFRWIREFFSGEHARIDSANMNVNCDLYMIVCDIDEIMDKKFKKNKDIDKSINYYKNALRKKCMACTCYISRKENDKDYRKYPDKDCVEDNSIWQLINDGNDNNADTDDNDDGGVDDDNDGGDDRNDDNNDTNKNNNNDDPTILWNKYILIPVKKILTASKWGDENGTGSASRGIDFDLFAIKSDIDKKYKNVLTNYEVVMMLRY